MFGPIWFSTHFDAETWCLENKSVWCMKLTPFSGGEHHVVNIDNMTLRELEDTLGEASIRFKDSIKVEFLGYGIRGRDDQGQDPPVNPPPDPSDLALSVSATRIVKIHLVPPRYTTPESPEFHAPVRRAAYATPEEITSA